jgi:hypothetical protein
LPGGVPWSRNYEHMSRGWWVGSVQIAVFREEDVRAAKPMSDEVRLKIDVTRLQKKP